VNTTLDSWISGGTRRAISGSSHELFVRQDGPIAGKPVTLLHGFPASSFDWAGVMPNLTGTGYRVTTLDFLGYGNSDKPYPYRYSLFEQASLVQAVWRDLGIERTALVAHDYGVSVAQELLSRDPGRIESMAWLNGGMFPDLHRPADFQRHLAELSGDDAEAYITENRYRKALLGVFGRPVPDHTLGEMWADFCKSGGVRVAPALLGYMAERREHAARWSRAVESYSGPQTFIWGPADPISGSHVLPRIRDKAPLASIIVLDNPPPVGHFPQVEAPKLVGSLLVKHLQDAANDNRAARRRQGRSHV
jgi:pimeloyl-ACP methyl ester carboxylesterase